MKKIYKIFKYMITFTIILMVVNYAKPYWNKYWLERHLESVAVFGTKHSLYETRDYLMNIVRAEGYSFKNDDFVIDKNEESRVSITLAYVDEVKIFGRPLKRLYLKADVSANEVKTSY